MNKKNKNKKYDELRELRFNLLLSMRELATHFRTSERTVYRWLKQAKINNSTNISKIKDNRGRPKKYP